MLTVEQYELIRRKHYVDGMSVRAIARELGHSRKTVMKALALAVPAAYRVGEPRRRPVMEKFGAIIEGMLEEDRRAPAKQRHSATRIYERLRDEHQFTGHEGTVRRFVSELRKARPQEAFLVLSFEAGEEGQVDWGEATVIFNGEAVKVQLFEMRLAFSNASFVHAYRRATLEAFLDGHVRAFEYFRGVPRRLAYDNLKSAVVGVERGRERRLTEGFLNLRSWYLFESRFCNVASGNEKGDVENLVKRSKHQYLTPVPRISTWDELGGLLFDGCEKDLDRIDRGRDQTRRSLLELERSAMLPLPASHLPACRQLSTHASKQALVRFDGNDYSVPVEHACRPCVMQGSVEGLKVIVGREVVAEHARSYESEQYILDPAHYVPLLSRKPGALDNALAFKGLLAEESMKLLRSELRYRHGPAGDRQLIAILQLLKDHPLEAFGRAVEECVRRRLFSVDAVRSVLRGVGAATVPARLDLSSRPELCVTTEGMRDLSEYQALIEQSREEVQS